MSSLEEQQPLRRPTFVYCVRYTDCLQNTESPFEEDGSNLFDALEKVTTEDFENLPPHLKEHHKKCWAASSMKFSLIEAAERGHYCETSGFEFKEWTLALQDSEENSSIE